MNINSEKFNGFENASNIRPILSRVCCDMGPTRLSV